MAEDIALNPLQLAASWPIGTMPLALWGALGERAVLPTALKQVPTEDFYGKRWADLTDDSKDLPKYIGVISYDEFCPHVARKAPSLIYEIHECLIWDHGSRHPRRVVTGSPDSCALRLKTADLKDLYKSAKEEKEISVKGSALYSALSDESYLGVVHDIQSAIRAGHYYQLNLLRWFKLAKTWTWKQVCSRIQHHGGPYSTVFRHGNLAVASFSPERFVAIETVSGGTSPKIKTWPIKGTAERNLKDPVADEVLKQSLSENKKDRAELSMIVDLMRNDLNRICKPQTVVVKDPGSSKTFQHVHHLQACIEGELRKELTMREIFSALCPGGSITGAPKVEVMKQIHALEGRERGFVMGNAFLMNGDGSLDSSILIRTMVSSDGGRNWNYAAGSGIVIKSNPEQELAEVRAKCRPLSE